MTSSDYIGKFTYNITDSYLKTADGKEYVFTVDSTKNPTLGVEVSEPTIVSSSDLISHGSCDCGISGSQQYISFEMKTVNVTVNLPLSVVDKVSGEVLYQSSNEDSFAYKINSQSNKLEKVSKFNILDYYGKGERKYYTSVWSSNKNIKIDCEKNIVKSIEKSDVNIKVNNINAGEGDFSSNINCSYGVYNKFFKEEGVDECDCPEPPCSDPDPDPSCLNPPCSDPDDGIQYIYRPIDLEDMFPNNRNPRWNWTGSLDKVNNNATGASQFASDSSLNYNVDPTALIAEVESKGESIYDVGVDSSEVDYEIVLTTENIRNIRNYNKNVKDYNGDGDKNYLDYNMSCYKNAKGQEVCTSKFLDNINGNSGSETNANFVTYSSARTRDMRKSIAGCNNAINGSACDDISK